MLEIVIPANEFFDEKKEEFITVKETRLKLEHSLISLKKWESKWHKPFLGNNTKTNEELMDYVRCMTIGEKTDPNIYKSIPNYIMDQIVKYIEDPMTATWFSKNEPGGNKKSKEIITNEIIYYWMIALEIPVEFEKWHLNQLLTLIRVVNIKNAPNKKMSRAEEAKQRAALNRARRNRLRTKG